MSICITYKTYIGPPVSNIYQPVDLPKIFINRVLIARNISMYITYKYIYLYDIQICLSV